MFFCVVFFVVHVSKKYKKLARRVGGCYLDNPSFSRIFRHKTPDKLNRIIIIQNNAK